MEIDKESKLKELQNEEELLIKSVDSNPRSDFVYSKYTGSVTFDVFAGEGFLENDSIKCGVISKIFRIYSGLEQPHNSGPAHVLYLGLMDKLSKLNFLGFQCDASNWRLGFELLNDDDDPDTVLGFSVGFYMNGGTYPKQSDPIYDGWQARYRMALSKVETNLVNNDLEYVVRWGK